MFFDLFHSFVNIFAGGRSDIKTVLFFVYLIFLISILLILKKKYAKTPKIKWRWFGVLLGTSYLYGLLLHIIYTVSRGLSPFDFLVSANNGELSSTIMWHMHEFKASIGSVLSLFGIDVLRASDGGGAYVSEIPAALLIIGFLLLTLMLFAAPLYFVSQIMPLLKKKTKIQQGSIIIFYAIASFSLVKAAVDGGVFTPAVTITLLFGWIFWRQIHLKNYDQRLTLVSILITSVLIVFGMILQSGETPLLIGSNIASLVALYSLLIYLVNSSIQKRYVVMLAVLFIASWISASSRDQEIYYYSQLQIKNGQSYLIYDESTKKVVTKIAGSTKTIGDLSSELGKNVSYSPVSAPGVTCFEKGIRVRVDSDIMTKQNVSKIGSIKSDYIFVSKLQKAVSDEDRYNIQFSIDPCTPEPLTTLNGYLNEQGITSYILINPKVGEKSANFE